MSRGEVQMLRRMSPLVAQNGHGTMSDLSPLCAPKRTSPTLITSALAPYQQNNGTLSKR
jgi:hypothetical protein